ncbi:MAG: trypsin-like peptidase domain-containing protein [Candidatus Eisenbacteria bacterium]|nr:trypsin-like peptidase domain-containing protein [Candidatus Eisenbacteria bacterium]
MYTEPSRGERRADRSTLAWMLVIFLLGLFGSYVYFDWREEQRRPAVTNGTSSADSGGSSVSANGGSGGSGASSANGTGGAGNATGTNGAALGDSAYAASPDGQRIKTTPDEIENSRRNAIVVAAEMAAPAVVSIVTYQTRLVTTRPRTVEEFFQYYSLPQSFTRQQVIPSSGSGVVVDPSGIVLTNEHVVRDAERIDVVFSDGRVIEARLAGSDPTYDLAVLKVDADEPLPSAVLGRSDDLQVGEWAIAIGNPFGLAYYDSQNTVTVGVISALHRDVRDQSEGREPAIYKNMIQTDAAINPGNSGGPLVNSNGEVIGINTFIFSQSGGSLGIGFAMPIETAVRAAREIIQFGEVRHVDLGIEVAEILPVVATRLRIADRRGLLVTSIERGTPGDLAGIEPGDIIRAINGNPVVKPREAMRIIFGVETSDTLLFTIERNGERFDVPVVAELPTPSSQQDPEQGASR